MMMKMDVFVIRIYVNGGGASKKIGQIQQSIENALQNISIIATSNISIIATSNLPTLSNP